MKSTALRASFDTAPRYLSGTTRRTLLNMGVTWGEIVRAQAPPQLGEAADPSRPDGTNRDAKGRR
jgi:hypothetical protein